MKRFFVSLAVAVFGLSFSIHPARAEENQTVQKVLENTKQYLDDLVTAKDEGNNSDDVNLRIKTFRQVLDLSIAEAKDFEFKLLTIDKDPAFEIWKKQAQDGLTRALVFFDSQRQSLNDIDSLTLSKIKEMAINFKSWRDKNYLPLVAQIQNFLFVKQEAKAIQTAQLRFEKITSDLKRLKRFLTSPNNINNILEGSKRSIGQAIDLNKQATHLFIKEYIDILNVSSSTNINATSTGASSTAATALDLDISSSTATTTNIIATTTPESNNASSTATSSASAADASSPTVSIKDLVKSSLEKIKDAYRGFIDISNLVRKLLG